MVVRLPNLEGVIPQSKDVFLDIFSIFIDKDQPLVYKTTVCRHTKFSFYFYSTCEKWHLWHFTDHLIKIVGTLFIYDRRYIHTWRDTEAANQSCSAKKVILRNFAKFTGKYLWWGPFEWISRVTDYDFMIEKTLTQVFPFEFYESFQNSFFAEQLWVSTSHPGMFTGGLQI